MIRMTILKNFWNLMWSWDSQVRNLFSFAFSVLTPPKTKKEESSEDELEKVYRKVTEPPNDDKRPPTFSIPQKIGLVLGPLLFTLVKVMPTPADMPEEANTVLAGILWVAVWWVTEAVPIPVTSLLPLILFPLGGVMEMYAVTASYGDSLLFLFAGSFMIALSMEKWNLHKRVALLSSQLSAPIRTQSYSASWLRQHSYPCGFPTQQRRCSWCRLQLL